MTEAESGKQCGGPSDITWEAPCFDEHMNTVVSFASEKAQKMKLCNTDNLQLTTTCLVTDVIMKLKKVTCNCSSHLQLFFTLSILMAT